MNGFIFKKAPIMLAIFLSSATFAVNTTSNKLSVSTPLGCMMCHQAGAMQSEKIPKKNLKILQHQHDKNAI